MKTTFAILALALSGVAGQVMASSPSANNGILPVTLTAGQFKTVGIPFARPVEDFGAITTTGTNLVDSAAGWTVNQWQDTTASDNRFDVEITSGRFIGARFAIQSNTATQLTVSGAVPLLDSGTTFVIRKAWTLAGLFGATNSAGLIGSDISSGATQIRTLPNSGSGFVINFYNSDSADWENQFGDSVTYARIPNDAFLVLQPTSGTSTFILSGEYRGTRLLSPVGGASVGLFTMVPNPAPLATSVAGAGFLDTNSVNSVSADTASQTVTGSDVSSSADQVRLLIGSGFNIHFANIDNNDEWENQGGDPANETVIPAGSAILFREVSASSALQVINPAFND